MYDRILIPTDGSVTARKAAREGLRLANDHGSRVTFLHVLENPLLAGYAAPEALPYSANLYQDLKRAAGEILDEALELAKEAGVDARGELIENRRAADAILEHAEDHDLVVMGTHGRKGFDRFVFGSVAELTLRRCPVPVLVVRGGDVPDEGGENGPDGEEG